MNTSALIVMLTTLTVVTLVTGYFFFRVLTTSPKPEPDTYTDSDGDAWKNRK